MASHCTGKVGQHSANTTPRRVQLSPPSPAHCPNQQTANPRAHGLGWIFGAHQRVKKLLPLLFQRPWLRHHGPPTSAELCPRVSDTFATSQLERDASATTSTQREACSRTGLKLRSQVEVLDEDVRPDERCCPMDSCRRTPQRSPDFEHVGPRLPLESSRRRGRGARGGKRGRGIFCRLATVGRSRAGDLRRQARCDEDGVQDLGPPHSASSKPCVLR